jgi:ABC-2 type transport system ATP-binding protein/nitrous oxidase accessory protein
VIVARELSLVLGARPILEGVSFQVARGESVALVGPNGSGKTSILRCVLGLVPFAGRVLVGGHDAVNEPVAARRLMAYVPQRAAFGEVTAREAVTFVAKLRRVAADRVRDVLAEVALTEHADQPVRTFSGGMQQRLSLAVALLADAPILLLDEPSASLDAAGQRQFFAIVAGLRATGRTLVLASHRPEEVASLTDRQLHLENGRLVTSRGVVPLAGRAVALNERRKRR